MENKITACMKCDTGTRVNVLDNHSERFKDRKYNESFPFVDYRYSTLWRRHSNRRFDIWKSK